MKQIKSTTRDWSQYNAAAKKSGEINFYISEEAIDGWYNKEKTGKRGASNLYSDIAIQACLAIRYAYNLNYRQGEGFINSLLAYMKLPLKSPDYTILCRRSSGLDVSIFKKSTLGPIAIAIDSTGLKVYGEGEWKVRQHGISKRRTWLKLHIAVDPVTHQIETYQLTQNNVGDSPVGAELIKQVRRQIHTFTGDGAYDTNEIYQACFEVKALPIIPPRSNAVTQSGTIEPAMIPRDFAIEYIQKHGDDEEARKKWKRDSRYHQRSLSETTMYRFKSRFGSMSRSRKFKNQTTEVAIKIDILNKIAALGTFAFNRTVT